MLDRPFTVKRPLLPNVLQSSSGNDGMTVVASCHGSSWLHFSKKKLLLVSSQQRSSTAGWKVRPLCCSSTSERPFQSCLSQASVWRKGLSTVSSLASTPASTSTSVPDTCWMVRHAHTPNLTPTYAGIRLKSICLALVHPWWLFFQTPGSRRRGGTTCPSSGSVSMRS